MTLLAKVGLINAPSSGSVTVTGVGFQPKALIFWATMRTTDGVFGGLGHSIGFATSTALADHFAVGVGGDDNAATANVASTQGQYGSRITNSSATSSPIATRVTALSSDGFTLNFVTTTLNVDIYYLALGGTSLTNAKAGSFTKATATGSQAITSVGFQPDCLLFLPGMSTTLDNRVVDAYMGLGAYLTSTKRWAIGLDSNDAAAAGDADRMFITDGAFLRTTDTGTVGSRADVTSFDANGFTLNWSAATAVGDFMGYLALQGASIDVGTLTVPAATGVQSITTSFRPAAVILAGINHATTGTAQTSFNFSFGAASATTERAAIHASDLDAADPTVQKSASHADRVYVGYSQAATPSVINSADLNAFNATSFDLNWTAVSGQPVVGYIVLGPAQGPQITGDAALDASGTQTAAGVDTRGAASDDSATGTLAATATQIRTVAATFDSTGSLTPMGAVTMGATVAITATGTIVADLQGDVPAASALDAASTQTAAGINTLGATVPLDATGTQTAAGDVVQATGQISGSSALDATGTATQDAFVTLVGAAAVDAASDFTAAGFNSTDTASALDASGTLTFDVLVTRNAESDLSSATDFSSAAVMTYGGDPSGISATADTSITAFDIRSGASALTAQSALAASGRGTITVASALSAQSGFTLILPTGFEQFGFANFSAAATATIDGADVSFQDFERTVISKRADALDSLFRRLDSRVDIILYKHQDAVTSYTSSAIGLDNERVLRAYATVVTNYTTDTVTITPQDLATLTQSQIDEWPQIYTP